VNASTLRSRGALGSVGLLVALAAGCSSGSSSGSPPVTVPTASTPIETPTETPTPTPTPTPSATVTETPTPTATKTVPVALSRCLSSNLSLSLGSSQGAAGSTYTPIVFTNHGSSACELHGYPGVSFLDSSGAQLGKPAREVSGTVKTIKLKSGGSANAMLRLPDPGVFDPSTCQPSTASRMRVFPPGETVPLFVKDHVQVCTTKTGRTEVRPVAAGTGG
jgi:hypothetical protein